ncbi:MAG: hypothetical protein ABIG37_00315 [Nanoarchaeota archaeon]
MNKKGLNKKGFFLAEETLKIILAVICIGFLIFILGKMYYSYSVDKEDKQAKDTLAYIEKEMNLIKDGEPPREIMIYNPAPGTIKGGVDWWILYGFSGQEKPSSCGGKDCVCICKNSLGIPLIGTDLIEKCDEKKICASFSGKISPNRIELTSKNLPMTLSITKSGGTISFFGR